MSYKIPKTKEEAFSLLDRVMKEDKVELKSAADIDANMLDAHFGLGLWIRNSWLYGKHAADVANLFMTTHLTTWPTDIVSSEILDQYATYLKKKIGK